MAVCIKWGGPFVAVLIMKPLLFGVNVRTLILGNFTIRTMPGAEQEPLDRTRCPSLDQRKASGSLIFTVAHVNACPENPSISVMKL